jgi:hypothetical protein
MPGSELEQLSLPVLGFRPGLRDPDFSLSPSRLLSIDRLIHHKSDVMAGTKR